MVDRGNIVVVDEHSSHPIYLYTHWGGHKLADTLASALGGSADCWRDGPYLARIIFDAMTRRRPGAIGYGISAYMQDNEHPVIVADTQRERAVIVPEADARDGVGLVARLGHGDDVPDDWQVVPFAEFDRLPAAYRAAH